MRVLLLADESFATREQRMLSRLEVGLADEGVRVARVSPEGLSPETSFSMTEQVDYEPPAPLLSVGRRAQRVLERIEGLGSDWRGQQIDLVHVFGERAWRLGLELARRAGAALALEVWSHRLLGRLRRWERRIGSSTELMWIAPGERTAEAVRAAGARRRCRLAPWGVHPMERISAFSDPLRPTSAVIVATGRDPGPVMNALEGLALASRRHEELMIFLDEAAVAGAHEVWRRIRKLHLLDRVSIITQLETQRDPVLRCDLFLRPEPSGDHRTITLDAMGAGMCVVAAPDDAVDALRRDETCIVCDRGGPIEWERAALRALDEPAQARRLGTSARDAIRAERTASRHVGAVLEAYASAAPATIA